MTTDRCESLHKCTGIHTAVLTSTPVEVTHWRKDNILEWETVVSRLDHHRDLILFPSADAISANDIQWTTENMNEGIAGHYPMEAGQDNMGCDGDAHVQETIADTSVRKRLVVLEATWNGGKTMARTIIEIRRKLRLPNLTFVTLNCTGISGQYWRFQEEGKEAVCTIEAISHTAATAGMPSKEVEVLLTLFNVQKCRVYNQIDKGGKIPRAMEVSGSWKELG